MTDRMKAPQPIADDNDELIAAVAECMIQFKADRIRAGHTVELWRAPEGLTRFDEARAIVAIVREYQRQDQRNGAREVA